MNMQYRSLYFEMLAALRAVCDAVPEETGYWVAPFGVLLELDETKTSADDLAAVTQYLKGELARNSESIRLAFVVAEPLAGEIAIRCASLSQKKPYRFRKQTFQELFINSLRREGYLTAERLTRRVRVRFSPAACREFAAVSVDAEFFQQLLAPYHEDPSYYEVKKKNMATAPGYSLEELQKLVVSFREGNVEVEPQTICNATRSIKHFQIPSLKSQDFALHLRGIALLPGQTLRVVAPLDVGAVKEQLLRKQEDKENGVAEKDQGDKENGDATIELPASEFDLTVAQEIHLLPWSAPVAAARASARPAPYQLLYVGARPRTYRVELYVPESLCSDLKTLLPIKVAYTCADEARWYLFPQANELQIASLSEPFQLLPGYLFKAESRQFRLRDMHLSVREENGEAQVRHRYEILFESTGKSPQPLLLATFSQDQQPEFRLAEQSFQLRLHSQHTPLQRSSTSVEQPTCNGATNLHVRQTDITTVLQIRRGHGHRARWESLAFDEPFDIGYHILKVSRR